MRVCHKKRELSVRIYDKGEKKKKGKALPIRLFHEKNVIKLTNHIDVIKIFIV